jgi:hypothetical protein
MSRISPAHYLNSPFGMWRAPADLVALWNDAPKVTVTQWIDGPCTSRDVPDADTKAGRAYYEREGELLCAIQVICSTDSMDVVSLPTRETRERVLAMAE